jgi:quinol monooxygenase YgiN
MSKIVVLASFYPKDDKNDEVKEILLSMINPTRLERGMSFIIFMKKKIPMIKVRFFIYLKYIQMLRH